jgi:SAM-dependent methyltransferase
MSHAVGAALAPGAPAQGERSAINRTMDRADLDDPVGQAVNHRLDSLVAELSYRGLPASSWYGWLDPVRDHTGWEQANRGLDYQPLPGAADDSRYPWFLYWEIAWLVRHNDFRPGQRLLDLGGSSSLFSCYLASLGLEVVTVDLNADLVSNGDRTAAAMGWNLCNLRADLRELDGSKLGGAFDHVTSVCVFEHLPISGRLEVTRQIGELLRPGGSFSITFDYANPSLLARIGSPADVERQFVAPTDLRVRGNREFLDNGKRYLLHPFHHPRAEAEGWKQVCLDHEQFDPAQTGEVGSDHAYTFGALFQERAG